MNYEWNTIFVFFSVIFILKKVHNLYTVTLWVNNPEFATGLDPLDVFLFLLSKAMQV